MTLITIRCILNTFKLFDDISRGFDIFIFIFRLKLSVECLCEISYGHNIGLVKNGLIIVLVVLDDIHVIPQQIHV